MVSTTQSTDTVATVIIKVTVQDGEQHLYLIWQKKMNDAAAKYTGYMDSEIVSPATGEDRDIYANIYRFASSDTLKRWLDSDGRRDLLGEADGRWTDVHQLAVASESAHERSSTLVISHDVPQGGVPAFLESLDKIQKVESTYPGYLGVTLLEPVPAVQPQWTSMVRFDSREHLEDWANSEDRQALLAEIIASGAKVETDIVGSSFGSWFNFNMKDGLTTPNWKQWLTVLLGLYPTVMLLGFVTALLPGGSQNLAFPSGEYFYVNLWLGNLMSTFILAFAVMPLLSRLLRWWLVPQAARLITLWGTALVILLFILSMSVFSV